jgi:hypothetical protein
MPDPKNQAFREVEREGAEVTFGEGGAAQAYRAFEEGKGEKPSERVEIEKREGGALDLMLVHADGNAAVGAGVDDLPDAAGDFEHVPVGQTRNGKEHFEEAAESAGAAPVRGKTLGKAEFPADGEKGEDRTQETIPKELSEVVHLDALRKIVTQLRGEGVTGSWLDPSQLRTRSEQRPASEGGPYKDKIVDGWDSFFA